MTYLLEHPEMLSKSDIGNKLSLLSEVREYGYDKVVGFYLGNDLEYITTLKGKAGKELQDEKERLFSAYISSY